MISRIRYLVAFYQGPRFQARDILPALCFVAFATCHPLKDWRWRWRAWRAGR
jgi:hypothetical protein